jgi:hypothetical protein
MGLFQKLKTAESRLPSIMITMTSTSGCQQCLPWCHRSSYFAGFGLPRSTGSSRRCSPWPSVNDIKDGTMSCYGSIISEIKARTSTFVECSFSHKNWAPNYKAHNLARHLISFEVGRHLWLAIPFSKTIYYSILLYIYLLKAQYGGLK